MKYKKILSWLKPFLRYGGHKICNFELFCWQHCWSDSLEILILSAHRQVVLNAKSCIRISAIVFEI
ncbi:hypothetical protein O3M35_010258 [Rhynocoris fuscipes]|uniref:Uncharacterized protein n=1 Tax=Rhynocoris fuscipes TaxID=488301 RepID=A0AAW1CZJ6_9HEMI